MHVAVSVVPALFAKLLGKLGWKNVRQRILRRMRCEAVSTVECAVASAPGW